MARMILKWRYFKSNQSKHKNTFVKYIATRDGVEKCDESWKYQNATVEQKRLINNLLKDFPYSKESFEYKDYLAASNKYNASMFISKIIDENIDLIGKKENYIGYIAKRPRVEKMGKHGLFSQDDAEIDLDKVATEVADHDGIVWNTIVSLKRSDAKRLGYDNAKEWRDMLRSKASLLARSMGIPLSELRWYAAFHNEGTHPHIHLVSFSVGKEPYMTRKGLDNFKAELAHEIFKQDLYNIYEEQNTYRDLLRQSSKDKIKEIIEKINQGEYKNTNIEMLLKQLATELDGFKGKRVYGYLPKNLKNIVNAIVDEIEKDERISELYNLWYEQKESVFSIYQNKMPGRVPLSANEEFKSIRNAVLKEAFDMHDTLKLEYEKIEKDDCDSDTKKQKKVATLETHTIQGVIRLFNYVGKIFQDDIESLPRGKSSKIDRKLFREIAEKKMAQGQKIGG